MGSVIRRWQRFRGGAGNLAPAISENYVAFEHHCHARTTARFVGAERVGLDDVRYVPKADIRAVVGYD